MHEIPLKLGVGVLLLLACAVHYKGLLTLQDHKITLSTLQGEIYHIHAGRDHKYLKQLTGCLFEVDAHQVFNHLFIQSWVVQDAGDGSSPYMGRLKRHGIQWLIHDHNSKGEIILEGLEKYLDPREGMLVMVGGYVTGLQKVEVVFIRVLDE